MRTPKANLSGPAELTRRKNNFMHDDSCSRPICVEGYSHQLKVSPNEAVGKYPSQGGYSVVAVMVSALIGILVLLQFGQSVAGYRRQVIQSRETLAAQLYASELLELLRSFKIAQFQAYLSSNPFAGNPPYKLCTQVNILDRQNTLALGVTKILNPDPIADLANVNFPSLLAGQGLAAAPNRYYQVQVVDITNMTTNKIDCTRTAVTAVLGPNERYLLTVGVSWVPRGGTVAEPRKVVLSSLLPN